MLRKVLLSFAAIGLSLSLVSCKSDVDKGNEKIHEMNAINSELAKMGIGVFVSQVASESVRAEFATSVFKGMTIEKLDYVIAKLDRFSTLGYQVLSILDKGTASYKGNRADLEEAIRTADRRAADARSIRAQKKVDLEKQNNDVNGNNQNSNQDSNSNTNSSQQAS